jgi:hypothetical protein
VHIAGARTVEEESVQDRDLAVMGQLYSLNIGQGLKFSPSDAKKMILDRALGNVPCLVFAERVELT